MRRMEVIVRGFALASWAPLALMASAPAQTPPGAGTGGTTASNAASLIQAARNPAVAPASG